MGKVIHMKIFSGFLKSKIFHSVYILLGIFLHQYDLCASFLDLLENEEQNFSIKKVRFLPQANTQEVFEVNIIEFPDEIHLHILNFMNISTLINLKKSCQFYNRIIDDGLLYTYIPKSIIQLFPHNTSTKDILVGHSLFKKGQKTRSKSKKKKLIKESAKLNHKEALKQKKKKSSSKVRSHHKVNKYSPSSLEQSYFYLPYA